MYTNLLDIQDDTWLYFAFRKGTTPNIGVIPALAKSRWSWIVQNWTVLKQQFTLSVGGDQKFLNIINDLSNDVLSYQLGNISANPFNNKQLFQEYAPLLRLINTSSLSLTIEEQIIINQESDRISRLGIQDFQNMIDFIEKAGSSLEAEIGLGDPDVADLLQTGTTEKRRDAEISDLSDLDDLYSIQRIIEGIIFDLQQATTRTPNLLTIANQNIDPSSQVAINSFYVSGNAVPFEISLESMAKKYLGTPDRWFELITVNNLKPPFIDESGLKTLLLAPAAVNNLIISTNIQEDVYVGSKIGVGSSRNLEETRVVERIVINNDNTMVLFLSGKQDLNKFRTQDNAFVRIYKPHTTRNGEFIIIPSTSPGFSVTSAPTPTNEDLRSLPKPILNFGIDVLKDTTTGDWVIGANGNFGLAVGTTAIRQAVLNALKTSRTDLNWHVNYGVNTSIGDKYYGTTDEAVILAGLISDSLLTDPRFADVKISRIQTTHTSIAIQLLVKLAGYSNPIPLSFIG